MSKTLELSELGFRVLGFELTEASDSSIPWFAVNLLRGLIFPGDLVGHNLLH
jgi:hypothetical protein